MVQVDPLARAMRYQPDEDSCWHIPVCLNYNRLTATLTGVAITILLVGFIVTIALLFPYSSSYKVEQIVLYDFVTSNQRLLINMTMTVKIENPAVPDLTVYEYNLRFLFNAQNYVLATLHIPKTTLPTGSKEFTYPIYLNSELESIDRSLLSEIRKEFTRTDQVACSLVGGVNAGYMFIRNGIEIDIPINLTDGSSTEKRSDPAYHYDYGY